MTFHQQAHALGYVAFAKFAQEIERVSRKGDSRPHRATGRDGLAPRTFPCAAASGHLGQVAPRSAHALGGAALAGRRSGDVGRVEYAVVLAHTVGADVRPLRILGDVLATGQPTDADGSGGLSDDAVVAAVTEDADAGVGGECRAAHGLNVSHDFNRVNKMFCSRESA